MSANLLIVGCGAIGGLFAAALSSVARVTALDANAEHVKAIRSRGLRVIGTNPRVTQIEAKPTRAEWAALPPNQRYRRWFPLAPS